MNYNASGGTLNLTV